MNNLAVSSRRSARWAAAAFSVVVLSLAWAAFSLGMGKTEAAALPCDNFHDTNGCRGQRENNNGQRENDSGHRENNSGQRENNKVGDSRALDGGWRLVRTRGQDGRPTEISIMHTADTARSDLDAAGLILRCDGASPPAPLIVVVAPLPPRSRPEVTISAAGRQWHFTGSTVPPGAEVSLPPQAAILASGAWRNSAQLAFQITNGDQLVRGVIPTAGMGAALKILAANCPGE